MTKLHVLALINNSGAYETGTVQLLKYFSDKLEAGSSCSPALRDLLEGEKVPFPTATPPYPSVTVDVLAHAFCFQDVLCGFQSFSTKCIETVWTSPPYGPPIWTPYGPSR